MKYDNIFGRKTVSLRVNFVDISARVIHAKVTPGTSHTPANNGTNLSHNCYASTRRVASSGCS